MSDKIEYSRLLMKRSTTTGEVPTIPPITAVTLNQFTPTDIFEGEFFLNSIDDLLWIRTENGILPISLSGSTGTTVTPTLTEVLYEGNTTNGYDIVVSSGDTVVFEGLTTGVSTNILAIDVSGNTIITSVSGSTGSSGTSGTSGSSGTSGMNGISAGRTYYFNQSQASDVADYKTLGDEPTTATTQTVTVSLPGNTNDNFVQQFITPELGFNVIPSGVQRFYLQFTKPAINDDISAYIVLQLTDFSGGTIGSPITSAIEAVGWNGTNPYELLIDVVLPTTAIDPTNRMAVAIYLNNYDATTHNTTFYTENGNYSFVITSVGVVAGTSGTSGTNGSNGTSGTNGSNGTSGTSGISGGDPLWTSGSSVGSVVTVAGSNTNTAKYTLIAGESNTVSQTHSTGVTSGNIVIGKNNVVDGNSIAVFGINNSVSNSVYNIAQGAGNIIYGGLYNGIFGGNHVISGGSYNYILGGILNKINPSGSNFSRSAIIGGALNVIDGSGGLGGSVILGGQGITATTSNMTYVPNLTIVSPTTGTSVANLSIDSTGKVIKSTGGPSNPYLQQEITIPSGNTNTTVSTNLNGSNGNFFLFNIVADTSNWTSANRTLIIQLTGITNFVNGTPIYIGLNIQHLTTGSTSNDYLNVFVTDISTDTNLTECAVYARATYSSSISYPINTWGSYLYGFNRGTLSVVKNNRIQ